MGYENESQYIGKVAAVGEVDSLGGKAVLPLVISGPHGNIRAKLWLNKADSNPERGFKSSFDNAMELASYLGCTEFRPPFAGMVSDKPVSFTVKLTPNPKGGVFTEAIRVYPVAGLKARNPLSGDALKSLFGAGAPVQTDTRDDKPTDSDFIPF